MNSDNRDLLDEVFLEALEHQPGTDRTQFLDRRCVNMPATVRAEIDKMLSADEEAKKVGFSKVARIDLTTQAAPAEDSQQAVGPFRLLQKLGEGGMGVVYMGEQREPIHRQVAIKLIRPGMDSKQVVARFEAERQALSLMEHPNIAKVLEVGTTEAGQPYFVMELVKGLPITKYCDEKQLSVRERIELFLTVCKAIQHAHQKGIVHRDLKPSNILVAEYDNDPVPKVIDFGLAKALQQRLTDNTLFTQFGQIVGTFEYMSPEQAKLNQLDIDTRTDVYSLGVLLYELLTGVTPFDSDSLRNAAFDEMLRVIREVEPPRPSIRFTTHGSSEELSARRAIDPTKLTSVLKGDLDSIVMKALDKERARRYDTSSALAEDLSRYLRHEPVLATPPSSIYLMTRFARRHRVTVALASASIILLLTTTIVMTMSWLTNKRLAESNEAQAKTNAAQAQSLALKVQENEEQRKKIDAQLAAWDLTDRSRLLRDKWPLQSVRLAEAAIATDRDELSPTAHGALLSAVVAVPGFLLPNDQDELANAVDISGDGRWGITHTKSQSIRLWDFEKDAWWTESFDITNVNCFLVSQDGGSLFTSSAGGRIRKWDLSGATPIEWTVHSRLGPITSFDVSPDGRWLAVGRRDGSVVVRDLRHDDPESIQRKLDFPGGQDEKCVVRFSPNGKWLTGRIMTATTNPTRKLVYLWDVEHQWMATKSQISHERAINATTFVGERWLVTASQRHVRVWDLYAGDPGITPSDDFWSSDPGVLALAGNPHNSWLAIGAEDLTIIDLDSAKEKRTAKRLVGHTGRVFSLSMENNGMLVSGGADSSVRVWDLNTDDPSTHSKVLRGLDGIVDRVGIGGGESFAIGGCSNHVRVWSLRDSLVSPSPFALRAATDGRINSISVSQDSRWLATGAADGTVRLWDLTHPYPGMTMRDLEGMDGHVFDLAMSHDARWLIASGRGQDAVLWDLNRQSKLPIRRLHHSSLRDHDPDKKSVAISPSGRWAATGSFDHGLRLWDLNGTAIQEARLFEHHTSSIIRTVISPDGRWLATSCNGQDNRILIWRLDNAPELRPIEINGHRAGIFALEFTIGGKLLTTGNGGRIQIWDCNGDRPKLEREVCGQQGRRRGTWQMAATDQWCAAIRFNRGPIDLYDLRGEAIVAHQIDVTDFGAQSLALSPDHRWLAAGTHSGVIFLWDLAADSIHESRRILRGHRGWVWTTTISADSRWLITGAEDGNVIVWPLDVNELLRIARWTTGRESDVGP